MDIWLVDDGLWPRISTNSHPGSLPACCSCAKPAMLGEGMERTRCVRTHKRSSEDERREIKGTKYNFYPIGPHGSAQKAETEAEKVKEKSRDKKATETRARKSQNLCKRPGPEPLIRSLKVRSPPPASSPVLTGQRSDGVGCCCWVSRRLRRMNAAARQRLEGELSVRRRRGTDSKRPSRRYCTYAPSLCQRRTRHGATECEGAALREGLVCVGFAGNGGRCSAISKHSLPFTCCAAFQAAYEALR